MKCCTKLIDAYSFFISSYAVPLPTELFVFIYHFNYEGPLNENQK